MRVCLDTNAAIHFLAGRPSAPLPSGEWLISVITELELRCYPFATPRDEQQVAEFIQTIPVIDLVPEVKTLAVALRRGRNIKLADAMVAAAAQVTQSILVTNDARLAQSAGVRCLAPALKA